MLNNDIASKLIQYIADNDLQAGSKLPSIRELAALWSCNPSQVRTGLITLSAIGIVDMHSRAGTFVKQLSSADMDVLFVLFFRLGMIGNGNDTINLYEVKTLLDKEVFRVAAKYRTERDLYEIEINLKRQEAALGRVGEYVLADEEFHTRLSQILRNPLVTFLMETIQGMIRPYRIGHMNPDICRESYEDHRRIYEVIRNGQEEKAESMAVGHSHQRLQRLVRGDTSPAAAV